MGRFPGYIRCIDCGDIFQRTPFSNTGTYQVRCSHCEKSFFVWQEEVEIFRVEFVGSGMRERKFVEVSDDESIQSRLEYMKKKAENILI